MLQEVHLSPSLYSLLTYKESHFFQVIWTCGLAQKLRVKVLISTWPHYESLATTFKTTLSREFPSWCSRN